MRTVDFTTHPHLGCLRVFGRVCKRLGDQVVRGDLGAFGQPLVDSEFELNRDGGTAREHLDRRAESPSGQNRWVHPPGYLLEVIQDTCQSCNDLRNLLAQCRTLGRHAGLGCAQLKPERDQPLLGTVVQIPFESTSSVITGCDDPGPRCGEFRAGIGVRDRRRDQVREVTDTCFCIRRKGIQRTDHGDAP